jgi:hypothetical protein
MMEIKTIFERLFMTNNGIWNKSHAPSSRLIDLQHGKSSIQGNDPEGPDIYYKIGNNKIHEDLEQNIALLD